MTHIYDRRVLRTKKLLREALTDLLKEKPLEKITVKELCDLSGINRSTFYLHYRDIYDMYEQIEEEVYQAFEAKLVRFIRDEGKWYEPLLGGQRTPNLSIFLEAYHFIKENSDIASLALGSSGDRNIVMRIYKKGKESFLEETADILSPQELSRLGYFYEFIASGCVGIITSWVESDMKETPERMDAITQEFILRAAHPTNG